MGSVYLASHTATLPDGTTERRAAKAHTIVYSPTPGKRVRVRGFADYKLSCALLAKLEREAEEVRAGIRRPSCGRAERPLDGLAGEYVAHLRAKGDTEGHCGEVASQLAKVFAGVTRAAHVEARGVEQYLARRRKAGLSAQTSNHYLRRAKSFCGWLVEEGVLPSNPLLRLEPVNVEVDRRLVRRVLAPAEFEQLLASTNSCSRKAHGLSGSDRAVLYQVASRTGLRSGELAALTPESLDLAADPPRVALPARRDKSRRGAELPLPPGLAAVLRDWLPGRPAGRPLWPGKWGTSKKAAAMLRRDLRDAGIPAAVEGRVYDFHALRSQFATDLVRSGVSLAVAQKLMRHSTPALTAKHYTRLDLADLAKESARAERPAA